MAIKTKEDNFKYEIGTYFKQNNLIIIDRKIIVRQSTSKATGKTRHVYKKIYQYKCYTCGYADGWKEESEFNKNGCRCCAGRIAVKGINTIEDKRPDLIQYFKNKDDASTVTIGSHKTINLICPLCQNETTTQAKRLVAEGFVCKHCGDHISYPEKFMMSFLNQMNIKFIHQLSKKHFSWCEKYKYDFYLPEYHCIIETNGSQHYNDAFNRSVNETISIDLDKKRLALENNIKYYIWLDCSISDMNFIKNNIIDSELVQKIRLDISNVNFELCNSNASKNLLKKVCDFYNNHSDMSTSEIAPFFHIHSATIWQYLKKGAKLGFCNYDVERAREESFAKTTKLCAINRSKPLECFKDDNSIGIFFNAVNASNYFQSIYNIALHKSAIGLVCRGKNKHHKGYTFKYITKEEYESRPQDQRNLPEEEIK